MKTSTALVIVGAGAVGVALYFYDKRAKETGAIAPPGAPPPGAVVDLSQDTDHDVFVETAKKIPVLGTVVTVEQAAYKNIVAPVTKTINSKISFGSRPVATANADGTVTRKISNPNWYDKHIGEPVSQKVTDFGHWVGSIF